MKVLVTGGAGFIGGVTVRDLIKNGFDVVVFDNFICGHKEVVPSGIKIIEGDLRNPADINAALASEQFDAVLHFAAFTIVPESIENPKKYFENNIYATFNLLNAMAENGVKKFVFSSSAAVYGNPSEVPVVESVTTCPTNAYGESKLIVEQYIKWYEIAYGIKYVNLRYFNAAGADLENGLGEDRDHETHLIPLVILAGIGRNKSVSIFGTDYPTRDGTCIRDYIHVKDLASAHVLAVKKLFNENPSSAIYNLGSEQGFTVQEVVDTVEKIIGSKVPVNREGRRAGDPPSLIASSTKIKSELGWNQNFSSLERIIGDTWIWMKENPNGYKK